MRTIAHGSEIHRAQRELTHRDSGTAENSALHKEWSFPRNAVLRGPRRLQFGGGHLQLRPALRILIGTDHVANLERRNAVPGGSPAALGDLDEQTVDAHQVRRSNPHATQHDRRAIIAEHLEKRLRDSGLRAIASLLSEEPSGGHRLDQPEGFITHEAVLLGNL